MPHQHPNALALHIDVSSKRVRLDLATDNMKQQTKFLNQKMSASRHVCVYIAGARVWRTQKQTINDDGGGDDSQAKNMNLCIQTNTK